MGNIFARLIYKQVYEGINTGYYSIADVKEKYQEATRVAFKKLFGVDAPETT